ncbi:MAG: hypothetical protein KTR26_22455 [Flammeovirgaceae bacterium]|nr:hypothetical protein [Flammeovirgaceae bacterium]
MPLIKKVFIWLLTIVLFLTITIFIYGYFQLKDRHPDYHIDLSVKSGSPSDFKVGFSAQSITPEIIDTWTDVNGDAKFKEEDGDTYQDNNNNGQFDAYWIAGFSNKRAANGINDKLWARTMVIDDGISRIAIVAIDAIGFGNDDVITAKKLIPEDAGITYSIITSSHTHESPDLLGLWGASEFESGINLEYMNLVRAQIAKSVVDACKNLRPAKLKIAQDLSGALPMLADTRKPEVYDEGLRLIQAVDTEIDTTLGTLLSWANHPETLWSDNLLITSDFPHYFRDGIENGVFDDDSLVVEGLGGIAVYVNGAIGGLMTTHRTTPIYHPFTNEELLEPTFAKAEAQGKELALLSLVALDSSQDWIEKSSIALEAKSIALPLDNPLFRLAAFLGVLDRGMVGWMKMRSEVAAWTLGPLSFIHMPGEIYPEIINGGVDAPEGQDFKIQPQEIPPLREVMPGKYKFVVGLSNDMIGYIVPKSQWDKESPYTYGEEDAPYGEINSVGPEAAPILHKEVMNLLKRLEENGN